MDANHVLVVEGCGEDFGFPTRDGRVPLNDGLNDTAFDLDAHCQRGDVEEQDVGDIALEDRRLNGRADGHDLVRIYALFGFSSKNITDFLLDPRHAGHTADHQHRVEVFSAQPGVFHTLFTGGIDAVDQAGDQRFEGFTAEFGLKMDGALIV